MNGQTEPKRELWVTRRLTQVRREAKFVRSKKDLNNRKIECNEIFQPYCNFMVFSYCIYLFLL